MTKIIFKKNQKLTDALLYFVIGLIIISLFVLQIKTSGQSNLLFLITFVMIFFAISEIFSTIAGIYAALLVVVLEISFPLLSGAGQRQHYFLLATLFTLIAIFYFLIKYLRQSRLETGSAREKYFRNLVNVNLQPIILKNNKGEVLFASESIKDLLGLKNNLKVGKSILEYTHPDDVHLYNNFLKQVLASPNEKKTVEYRVKRGEGDWIWVRNDAVNLLKHKDVRVIVSSIQDITFQKELDREKLDIIKQEKNARALAEKAVRDRDEFLSIASHELKTPLTTVLLQLQATLRKISTQSLADFSGNDLLNSLQIAEKQSQSLASLIKDLLNISVASTGKLTLNKEKVNLASLVESFPVKYAEEIKLSRCIVNTVIKDSEIVGDWDPIRVEQAMSNLFMNALKYAEGKDVTIVAKKEDGWGIFQVKDNGKGIEKELQKEIFEPFQRANINSNVTGLGVGLFIARQIALGHGGDITVRSKVGKGSTFTLRLPLAETKQPVN